MPLSKVKLLALVGTAAAAPGGLVCEAYTSTLMVPCGDYVTVTKPYSGTSAISMPIVASTILPASSEPGTIVIETPTTAPAAPQQTDAGETPAEEPQTTTAGPEQTSAEMAPGEVQQTTSSPEATSSPESSAAPTTSSPESSSESPTSSQEATSTESHAPTETSDDGDLAPVDPFGECATWRVRERVLYTIDLATGKETELDYDISQDPGQIDAIGYNTLDGYIYGVLEGGTPSIIGYGKNGTFVLESKGLPVSPAGEVDDKGMFWLFDSDGNWYRVDLATLGDGYGMIADQGSAPPPDGNAVNDWAIIYGDGSGTDYVWSVGQSDSGAALLRWSRDTKAWENVKDLGNVSGNNEFGSIWGSGDGYLWGLEDTTGEIYRWDTTSDDYTQVKAADAPTADPFSDGTRCPKATGPALPGDM